MKNRFLVIRSLAWLLLLGLVVLSLVPIPAPPTDLPNSDKWLHLFSYLVLAYAFLHAYPLRPGRVLIGLLGLGMALESAQTLTPHRYFEGLDLLMNVTGVLLASGLFLVLHLRVRKWMCR